MEPNTPQPPAEETIGPLCGVLMYEDREAHARALNLYAHLAIEISGDIPIEFSWWAMPVLHTPENATAARDAVLAADLLVVAARPAADWPMAFKLWIESWTLPKQKKLSALGALFLSSSSGPNGMCGRQAYLEQMAKKLELDFLIAPPDPTASHLKAKLGLTPTPNIMVAPAPHNVMEHPDFSPYCGING